MDPACPGPSSLVSVVVSCEAGAGSEPPCSSPRHRKDTAVLKALENSHLAIVGLKQDVSGSASGNSQFNNYCSHHFGNYSI